MNPAAPIPPYRSPTSPASTTRWSRRAADRARAADLRGVLPGSRLRRTQRPVRLRVPERASGDSTTRRSRGRRSARPGSLAGSSGPTCRTSGCRRSPATSEHARQPTHRALADAEALRGGASRTPRARRAARHPDARRPPRGGSRAWPPELREDRAGRASLPRSPGVYLFRGRDGRVLYVGKAKDLRARVKSYFYGDERKKVEDLLDEVRLGRRHPTRRRAGGARRSRLA